GIAKGMAVTVVQGFEPVQINEQQGQITAPAAHPLHGMLQPRPRQYPVGQAGQHVIMRQLLKLTLIALDKMNQSLRAPEYRQHQPQYDQRIERRTGAENLLE